MKTIKTFPTIDLCVDYLMSIGCVWDNCKELSLRKKKSYTFKDVVVFYDKYEILA